MQVRKSPRIVNGGRSMAVMLVMTPSVMAFSGGLESSKLAAQQEPVRIEVSMKEFAFGPDTLRIPAGKPVTLVFKNDGVVPHEFMAGREAEGGHFEHDLFEGLHINMMTGEMAEEAGGEHGHAAAGGHGGEDHGTMIMAQAKETVMMSFTLPESLRGAWNMGCFLPGHYEAGMRGTIIVE